jgi:magnesium chelatase family protein
MRATTMSQMNLSARAYHCTRSVKLARTIADLAGSEDILSGHLAEALHASQPSEVNDWVNGVIFNQFQMDL